MKRRVVVTGLGVVTSLSCQVEDLWKRILAGESGVHKIRLFDTTGHKVHIAGDVYDWSATGYLSLKDAKRIDRFTQFAMVAGIDAVRDADIDFKSVDPFRAGVILGSGIGGLHEIETQVERLLHKGPDKVSAFTIPKLMLNAASGQISIEYGLRGPNYAVATACASATNAIGDAFKCIQYDEADVMITGGSEAAITPMGISGFANMRAEWWWSIARFRWCWRVRWRSATWCRLPASAPAQRPLRPISARRRWCWCSVSTRVRRFSTWCCSAWG